MRAKITRISLGGLCAIILAAAVLPFGGVAQDTKENAEFKLAVKLFDDGLHELALEQFNNFIKAYPASALAIDARFHLGLAQLKTQRYDDARVTFQHFALTYANNPKAPEAWMRAGEASVGLGNYRDAGSAYERVHIFHPTSPLAHEALLNAAVYYLKAGLADNARKAVRTLLQDYPGSASGPAARVVMGQLYIDEGRWALAQAELERARDAATHVETRSHATLLLGVVHKLTGRLDDAERFFNRVLADFPGTSHAVIAAFELGQLLASSGRHQDAVAQFQKVYEDGRSEDQIRARALIGMADAYYALEDYRSAGRYYEQFSIRFPSSEKISVVQYLVGRAAAKAGDHVRALQWFDRVISDRKDDLHRRRAIIAAAETEARRGNLKGTASYYARYLEDYPADPFAADVLMRLGQLYRSEFKDPRRAIGYFENVLSKHPRSSLVDDAQFAIAQCWEELGEASAAVSAYRQVERLYGSSLAADNARTRANFLEHHKLKNPTAGVERLAHLMGEVINNAPKPELLLTLADVYFFDLKDYAAAARVYSAAIDGGLDRNQFVDAYFRRARSYHLLSELDSSVRVDAEMYYQAFLKQFPNEKQSDEAAFYSLVLRSTYQRPSDVVAQAREFASKRANSPRRAEALLLLADALERTGQEREAIEALQRIRREFPQSPVTHEALVRLGRHYAAQNRLDSAAAVLGQAVNAFPHGRFAAEALWLLAELSRQRQQYSEASEYYKRLMVEYHYSPYAAKAEIAVGDAYLAAGEFTKAIGHFESLWTLEFSRPFHEELQYTSLLRLAGAYHAAGDRSRASSLYQQYLQFDRTSPAAADALLGLGSIAKEEGNPESAAAYIRRASAISTSDRSSRDVADLLFQTGQYAEAFRQYGTLYQTSTDEEEKQFALLRQIICKLRLDDLRGAQPLVGEFAKSYRRNTDALAEIEYETGLAYYRAKNYTSARRSFETVAGTYGRTVFGLWGEFYQGRIFEATNRPQDAVRKYDAIVKRASDQELLARSHLALGNISYRAERYQEAIPHYQRAVELSRGNAEILPLAMNNLIQVYDALQLYDAALQVTREYVSLFPHDPDVVDKRINMGILFTRLGYYDQAAIHLQQLLDVAPSDLEAEIRYALGEAYYSKGDYQQAILEFLKVPYLVTRQGRVDWTATSLYMAGQAYEKMQRFDQAITMYQQIIDRPGIDATFKAAARKEIDRVKAAVKPGSQ